MRWWRARASLALELTARLHGKRLIPPGELCFGARSSAQTGRWEPKDVETCQVWAAAHRALWEGSQTPTDGQSYGFPWEAETYGGAWWKEGRNSVKQPQKCNACCPGLLPVCLSPQTRGLAVFLASISRRR